jgi:hypothetical protein
MADNTAPRIYKPSERLLNLLAAWNARVDEEKKARIELEKGIAAELTEDLELTNREISEHLPWSEENIRLLARKYNVPRRRKRGDDHRIIEKDGQPAQVVVPYDWYQQHKGDES